MPCLNNTGMKKINLEDLLINTLIPFSGFRIVEQVNKRREELGKYPLTPYQKICAYTGITILEIAKIGAMVYIGHEIYKTF